MTKKNMPSALVQNNTPISAMRNLGPAVEEDLKAAGVTSAEQIKALGVEATFEKMLQGRLKRGRSAKCCNALYLYALYGAIHNADWRDVPEDMKNRFKAFTKKLRDQGKYAKSS